MKTMKLINLTFIIIVFLASCGQRAEKTTTINTSIDGSTTIQDPVEENEEPDTKQWRKEYISNYSFIEKMDTSFTDLEGKLIHVQTKYYCLFDN